MISIVIKNEEENGSSQITLSKTTAEKLVELTNRVNKDARRWGFSLVWATLVLENLIANAWLHEKAEQDFPHATSLSDLVQNK